MGKQTRRAQSGVAKSITRGYRRRGFLLQRIRRRDIILLTGAISLACFSLIVVAMIILRSQSALGDPEAVSSSATPTPGPKPTHTVTYVQITGLTQYPLAEAAAQAWSDDAKLVSANADWPQIINMDQIGSPTAWTYRFYSTEKERLFFAVVEPGGAVRTIEHGVRVTLPPRTIDLAAWSIDSPSALAIWLDYGGSRLLRTNPGLELVVQLRTLSSSPDPVWMVVGLDNRTEDIHIIAVDANEGAVVTTSPES